jgi:hypothetical protein
VGERCNLLRFIHLSVAKKPRILLFSAPLLSSSELAKGNYVYLKYNQLNHHPLCSYSFVKVIIPGSRMEWKGVEKNVGDDRARQRRGGD